MNGSARTNKTNPYRPTLLTGLFSVVALVIAFVHSPQLAARTFDSSGTVLQSTDYYPFGLAFSDDNIASNRYLYNGKELEDYTLGTTYLGTLDYGARHYDPRIARWTVPDPMAESSYALTAYGYCGNKPVLLLDPDGQFPETVWDIANLMLDIQSLVENIRQGKVGASIVDGVGLVVDAAATAFPFVPGGAGTAIKGVRAADKAVDAIKAGDRITNLEKEAEVAEGVLKETTKALHRPYILKSTREAVESATERTPEGYFLDAHTRAPIYGPYDLGHTYGNEFWRHKANAKANGMDQKTFNNIMNDPLLYQIEDPHINRSRRYEKK